MNTETLKAQAQQLVNRGQDIAKDGQKRAVIVRSKSGQALVETNLTVVVSVSIILMITGLVSIPFALIVAAIAYALGVRVELAQPTTEGVVRSRIATNEASSEATGESTQTIIETAHNLS